MQDTNTAIGAIRKPPNAPIVLRLHEGSPRLKCLAFGTATRLRTVDSASLWIPNIDLRIGQWPYRHVYPIVDVTGKAQRYKIDSAIDEGLYYTFQ
jgi:hypothetical protein